MDKELREFLENQFGEIQQKFLGINQQIENIYQEVTDTKQTLQKDFRKLTNA